jgi:hypothetical protein
MIHMQQTIMKNNPILIVKLLKLSMLQFSKEITFWTHMQMRDVDGR